MEAQAAAPRAPTWPVFTGTPTFVGTSSSGVSVWWDKSLGAPGLKNAQDLLADADRVRAANDAMFGTQGGPVNVLVWALNGPTDGTGGADHASCDYATGGNIEVDASFGDSMRCSALFEAELSECSMDNNLCGLSTGEALSRWAALWLGNSALADFTTVPDWAKSEPDWVNKTQDTDQNPVSIGCGMAFLSWMQRVGYPMNVIAPAMVALGSSGTLAELYASLTGDAAANAWAKFKVACATVQLTTEDPFGALAGSEPVPQPKPPPTPAPQPAPAPSPMIHLHGALPASGPSGGTTPVTLQGHVAWPVST